MFLEFREWDLKLGRFVSGLGWDSVAGTALPLERREDKQPRGRQSDNDYLKNT